MTKMGIKTSEFWLLAISTVVTFLNQTGLLGIVLPLEAIMTMAAPVVAYVLGRSWVKAKKPE